MLAAPVGAFTTENGKRIVAGIFASSQSGTSVRRRS
jgi:hypothetical protein